MESSNVAVIMPCYNVEKYIDKTIMSLLAQTFKDFKVYCIDDCSTDGTYTKLSELSAKNPRIKAYRNEVNLGVIGTLNKLIDICDSEWIIRMDSDDIFEKDRVEKLLTKAKEESCYIVSSAYSFIDFQDEPIVNKRELYLCTLDKSIRYMALLNSPFPSQALFNKQVFVNQKFDYEFKVAEDYYFFTKILKKSNFIVANLSEKLYKYRINPTGLSNLNEFQMRKNHYEIAVEYGKDILGIEKSKMQFLEIGLKLLDYEKYTSRQIAEILKSLFQLKNLFMSKFPTSNGEKDEINKYTNQYFLYLIYTFGTSNAGFAKKMAGLLLLLPTFFKVLNIDNLKWLFNNK